jgi:hypothetical protein
MVVQTPFASVRRRSIVANLRFEFDEYRLKYGHSEIDDTAAILACYRQASLVGLIQFVKEDLDVLGHKAVRENADAPEIPLLRFSITRFDDIITTLRYEKPLFIEIDTETGYGGIRTTMEPVGEEEGKRR